jgi:hypothetical protein
LSYTSSTWAFVPATSDATISMLSDVPPAVAAGEFPPGAVGAEITHIGILFLRFTDDGRCAELRETWLFEDGDHAPHEGWGM